MVDTFLPGDIGEVTGLVECWVTDVVLTRGKPIFALTGVSRGPADWRYGFLLEAAVGVGGSTGDGIELSLAVSVNLVAIEGVLLCLDVFEDAVLSLDRLYLMIAVLVCPELDGVMFELLDRSSYKDRRAVGVADYLCACE